MRTDATPLAPHFPTPTPTSSVPSPVAAPVQSPSAALGRVAFVMSHALGDSLVSMVIVDNLRRNGVDVEVFGSTAHVLREWFPDVRIAPLPPPAALRARLAAFHTVIQMQHDQPVADLTALHPRVRTLHDVEFGHRRGCMAERFADFCRNELGLADVDLDNGMRAPAGLQHRRHAQRIVIHPEASTDDKRWSAHRFIRLAHRLRERGFEVYFVIAPHERERWPDLDAHRISAPHFADLHLLACWVYESGWFIGNDSGVGHLASNLGIPTISLFRRRGVAQRWRPAWGETRVVLSWQWVPTARLKEIFWRETLTCARVLAVFSALAGREAARGRASGSLSVRR
ncbi:glycosyl transferase [Robbsia sp. Bb-Pol-6]|uniref:Glycosyl transferase n=1 Tax=Robbsia betulipollinis TaxID=2981849 RepID=A0ABT3ZNV5_9BURK|nr:glycosyltransferase family 9 protein [Robbsia betulipollinis]MCY0388228.1 glycosyl transferase [Robbsia betulipollinis]